MNSRQAGCSSPASCKEKDRNQGLKCCSRIVCHQLRVSKCMQGHAVEEVVSASTDESGCLQDAKPLDKAALIAQCEPLLAVAEAHAEGKEAFARSIATELFSDFLSVEERFAGNKEATEQEVIDSLRQVIVATYK